MKINNCKQERKGESFSKGIFILAFSQVIIKAMGLIYTLYLTNKAGFGDKGNGILAASYQIYAILLTLSSIGVPNAISKLVSEKIAIGDYKSSYKIFQIAFKAFFIIGLLGSLLLIYKAEYMSNNVLKIEETRLTLLCLAPSIVFVAISAVLKGYFIGRKKMSISASSQIVEQMFKTFFTIFIVEIIAISITDSYEYLAAGATIATTIATIIGFIYLYICYCLEKKEIHREINKRSNIKEDSFIKVIKNIFIVMVPMVITSILFTINRNIDSITVVRFLSKKVGEEIAIKEYGILAGKIDTLTTLPLCINVAFATALIPAISSAKAKKRDKYIREKTNFSILVSMVIGIPCSIGMLLYAKEILTLLFPLQNEGSELLKISCFSIIFALMNQSITGILQGIGKGVIPIVSLGIGVIFKLIMNIILIPLNNVGIKGAAIATVMCYMVATIIELIYLKKKMNIEFKFKKFMIKPLIASIIMGVISKKVYINIIGIISSKWAIIITIIIAAVIYFIGIIFLKIFRKEEIYNFPTGALILNILEKLKIY